MSVQHELQIVHDISIQNNPINEDISIQHKVSNADISLQNAPLQDDAGIQMSREEAEYSVQAVVNYGDVSIQYSAKPHFESISKDFVE